MNNNIEQYIKELAKYQNWKKENKDGQLWESITEEKSIDLYNTLVKKMNTGIFINKKPNKFNELNSEEIKSNFTNISTEEKVNILLEILNLLTNKKSTYNLKAINIKTSRGVQNFDLSNLNQFSIIEQSVTGFYEKEITIIGDKGNDVENSNS